MEFRFNVNKILPKRINKITNTLLPEDFRGDRREYNDCQRLLTKILDDIGEASAKAQGLNRTITTASKLRETEHTIYLMVDKDGNKGNGSVIGLLKTGSKTLFMFDENGLHYRLTPRCILDFYIHESRQRMGLGKELYQHMLKEENLTPIKLAIDRPSDKFLAFLLKHYNLQHEIPQNNKFVVFKGFFSDEVRDQDGDPYQSSPRIQTARSMEYAARMNNNLDSPFKSSSTNGSATPRSPYGRFAASRPQSFMADIIHNTAVVDRPSRGSRPPCEMTNLFKEHQNNPEKLQLNQPDLIAPTKAINLHNANSNNQEMDFKINRDLEDSAFIHLSNPDNVHSQAQDEKLPAEMTSMRIDDNNDYSTRKVDNKLDCYDLDIPDTSSELTEGGHLDLKFYHSPLW